MSDALPPVARLERAEAPGPALIVCEHASNTFPAAFGTLGLSPAQRQAHIAWDPGALGLARGLAERLDAPLIRATLSRLIYDLNRPPHAPGAMAERSELHDIPGNRNLPQHERLRRTESVYLPFHRAVSEEIARRLARGIRPALITIHSFTPVYHGAPRAVEFGIIHDADPTLAHLVAEESARLGLDTRLNEPYSAADGVTHTLKLHATPYGLPHVMLEVRNDLISTPDAEAAMAARLAPVLARALARLVANETAAAAK